MNDLAFLGCLSRKRPPHVSYIIGCRQMIIKLFSSKTE